MTMQSRYKMLWISSSIYSLEFQKACGKWEWQVAYLERILGSQGTSVYHALRGSQRKSMALCYRSLITRNWRTGLLFGMTCLMREILSIDVSRMVTTAHFVCRLCDIDVSSEFCCSPFDSLMLVRALFWAGFVFTSPVDREGMNPGDSSN